MMKTTNKMKIELDTDLEEIINCAVRYACGRRTYVVSNVCSFIKPLIPNMSTKWLKNIICSIDMQRENKLIDKPLGDDCDIKEWNNLYTLIIEELDRR